MGGCRCWPRSFRSAASPEVHTAHRRPRCVGHRPGPTIRPGPAAHPPFRPRRCVRKPPRAFSAPNAKRNFRVRSYLVLGSAFVMAEFGRLASAFDEGPFDMMLGYELPNDLGNVGWHRYGFDQIAAGFCES